MIGEVLIALPDELMDKLEDRCALTGQSVTAIAAAAIGAEADWQTIVDADRLPPLNAAPAGAKAFCSCCPNMRCQHVLVWRGTARCACTPDRVGPPT